MVGASSLKGKEIKEVFGERHLPIGRLVLLDAQEEGVKLTEFEDEPAIIEPITKESFEDVAMAIFASSPAFTREHWEMAASGGCDIIDASYFLESHPSARLRAPSLETLSAGENQFTSGGTPRICVPAHPVAVAIAAVLGSISRLSAVTRAVVNVFEPVSEHGQAGVDELHQQTLKLLSFQQIPTAVFDSQVAFTMLSHYGEESRPTLHDAQERIRKHAGVLLGAKAPIPTLRVLHAPVFHGHAFSCFVELQEPTSVESLESAVDHKPLSVSRDAALQPNVVSMAGSDEITLGSIEQDPACRAGYWIWGAFDNLRIAAINTADIAERLIAERFIERAS
ncbi:MAG: hypothetical protein HYX72_13920 [Acidobacteria bacterium]|nr:hypothetical protein [Acidobacteriota bacterium]